MVPALAIVTLPDKPEVDLTKHGIYINFKDKRSRTNFDLETVECLPRRAFLGRRLTWMALKSINSSIIWPHYILTRSDGISCLAKPICEGPTLAKFLEGRPYGMTELYFKCLIIMILKGLKALQDQNLVHYCLSPEYIVFADHSSRFSSLRISGLEHVRTYTANASMLSMLTHANPSYINIRDLSSLFILILNRSRIRLSLEGYQFMQMISTDSSVDAKAALGHPWITQALLGLVPKQMVSETLGEVQNSNSDANSTNLEEPSEKKIIAEKDNDCNSQLNRANCINKNSQTSKDQNDVVDKSSDASEFILTDGPSSAKDEDIPNLLRSLSAEIRNSSSFGALEEKSKNDKSTKHSVDMKKKEGMLNKKPIQTKRYIEGNNENNIGGEDLDYSKEQTQPYWEVKIKGGRRKRNQVQARKINPKDRILSYWDNFEYSQCDLKPYGGYTPENDLDQVQVECFTRLKRFLKSLFNIFKRRRRDVEVASKYIYV